MFFLHSFGSVVCTSKFRNIITVSYQFVQYYEEYTVYEYHCQGERKRWKSWICTYAAHMISNDHFHSLLSTDIDSHLFTVPSFFGTLYDHTFVSLVITDNISKQWVEKCSVVVTRSLFILHANGSKIKLISCMFSKTFYWQIK